MRVHGSCKRVIPHKAAPSGSAIPKVEATAAGVVFVPPKNSANAMDAVTRPSPRQTKIPLDVKAQVNSLKNNDGRLKRATSAITIIMHTSEEEPCIAFCKNNFQCIGKPGQQGEEGIENIYLPRKVLKI